MTAKERITARLQGKTADRLPNTSIIMTFAAKQYNVPYSKYVTDYKTLVDCNLKTCEKFGIDLLCAISDPTREAEGFGAELNYPYDNVPNIIKTPINDITEVSKLKVIKSENGKRMYDRIMAVRLMREKSDEHMVAGWVEGAFAEACDVRGINEFMVDILMEDDEEYVLELLDKCYAQALDFALAQIKAGAHMIGIGDAAASLISPDMYQKFALPYEIKLIEKIHAAGAYTKLHICGNITKLLPLMSGTKSDIIDVDWMVDINSAVTEFEKHGIAASGNFDPVAVLLQGTPETVANSVKACIINGAKHNMIAAGCEVPTHTPEANLMSIHNTLKV